MPQPEAERCTLVRRPSGSDASSVLARSRNKRGVAACVLGAALLLNCQSSKSPRGTPVGSSGAASQPHAALGGSGQEPSHGGAAGGEVAKSASPSKLSADARAKLTTIRVSAHEGYVIARREPEGWVISGPGGCTVRAERIDRALHNLSVLKSVPTTEAVPHGTACSPPPPTLQAMPLPAQARHFINTRRESISPLPWLASDLAVGEGDRRVRRYLRKPLKNFRATYYRA